MTVRRTFVAYVEDKVGVLNRVVSLFRRRGYNIESLTVGQTERDGVSRVTVVLRADDDTAKRMVANLYKLVNVLRVDELHEAAVVRELALIKVGVGQAERGQVLQLCDVFRARPVDISPDAIVIEISGAQDKIDGLVDVLRPYGIQEMVRTGAIAMTRGATPASKEEDQWLPSTTIATQTSA